MRQLTTEQLDYGVYKILGRASGALKLYIVRIKTASYILCNGVNLYSAIKCGEIIKCGTVYEALQWARTKDPYVD